MKQFFFLFFLSQNQCSFAASSKPALQEMSLKQGFEPLLEEICSEDLFRVHYNQVPCLACPLLFMQSSRQFYRKSEKDQLLLAQELLKNGADMERPISSKTILDWTLYFKHKRLFEFFLSRGAAMEHVKEILDHVQYEEYKEYAEALNKEKRIRSLLKERYEAEFLPLLVFCCGLDEAHIADIIHDYCEPKGAQELMLVMGKRRKDLLPVKKEQNCFLS